MKMCDYLKYFSSGVGSERKRYRFFFNLSSYIQKYRWPVVLLTLAATLFSIFFIRFHLKIDNSLESYFMEKDDTLAVYHQYLETFKTDQFVYILIEQASQFSPESFVLIKQLSEELSRKVPYILDADADVISLSHMDHVKGTDDALTIFKPKNRFDKDPAALTAFKKDLLNRRLYIDQLISKDATISSITLSITPPEDKQNWHDDVTKAVYGVLGQKKYQHLVIHPVGMPLLNTVYKNLTRKETFRNAIYTAIAMVILLLFFLHRFHAVVLPISLVLVGLSWVFAVMAAFTTMNITTGIIPPLILAIGTCAAIHVLAEFRTNYMTIPDKADALSHTIGMVGFPVFLASVTTAVGFLSLAVAPIKPVKDTGIIAAAGTMISFLLSISFLPAAISIWPLPKDEIKTRSKKLHAIFIHCLGRLADFNVRHPKKILCVFLLLFIIAAYGIALIRVETNWLSKFDDRFRIKKDYLYVDKHMGGSQSFEILLTMDRMDAFKSPEILKQVEAFQTWLENKEEITHTASLVDLVKTIHMTFYEDDTAEYRIPEDRRTIAQLLLLFELGGSRDLPKFVTTNYKQVHISVRAKNTPDERVAALFKNIEAYGQKMLAPYGMSLEITGTGKLFIQTYSYIMQSQIMGFGLAFVVISFMMIFVFKSFKIGLVSMVPNLTPIILTLGFMGFAGIPLDTALMLNASIAIGIAVDDTIHFFNRYRFEYGKSGDYEKALETTFSDVGQALLFTTVTLTIGFLVVSGSPMKNIAMFGLISSLTVVLAWIADMFLAPALILTFKPFKKDDAHEYRKRHAP